MILNFKKPWITSMNKIKSFKKLRNDTYLIEIETKKATIPHIISENTIVKYNLLSKEILTDKEYKKIIQSNEYEILYLKAINYISYQMRTISEVKKHLRKDTKKDSLINQIIEELKAHKYLNDRHFVTEYIAEKMEYDTVGPKYIKDKLVSKGIHFDLIHEGLLQYTEDVEYDKINQLLDKELRYKIKKTYQKAYLSLKQKLIQKGFHLNVVESSLFSRKDDIKSQIDDESLLQKDFHKVASLYDLTDYNQKTKLIKKLIAKGHNYERVKTLIEKEGNK